MKEVTCFTTLLPTDEVKSLSFEDILLDERWVDGGFQCSDDVYSEIGHLNQKLHAKQDYEFLLRAAEKYSIKAIGRCISTTADADNTWDSFCSDCYIVGKYQEKLRQNNYFDSIVTLLIQEATQSPWPKEGILFLEKMISRASEYYEIDDNTRPILLYYGSDFCLNLLNLFIDSLYESLLRCHQRVEVYDLRARDTQALTQYINQHFKAIIGVQNPVFTIKMQDGITNLHDLIIGPKFNIILDHPAWLKDEIQNGPKEYYLLIHDRNYIEFATAHFRNIAGCIHFPLAGFIPSQPMIPMEAREYDVTFIGSYRDYRERLAAIYSYDRTRRHVAGYYLKLMHRNPDYTAEHALEETMKHFGIPIDSNNFLQLFYDMRQVYFCILLYYREKIIQTLLDAGIHIHVFSESWNNAPFANHPCITCHPDIDAALSLGIMQNSKISLNIMSWHKDGMTERVFNAMLCQSVVVSDRTAALEEEFDRDKDLMLFSLDALASLPNNIHSLLADNKGLHAIALNGYQKASQKHTWTNRAKQLLQIINQH